MSHQKPPIPILKDMSNEQLQAIVDLTEARILSISKDDLRMDEKQLLWSDELEVELMKYWQALNTHWERYNFDGSLPPCTCADHENGFLAREAYNPYYYNDKPCSVEYFKKWQKEQTVEIR